MSSLSRYLCALLAAIWLAAAMPYPVQAAGAPSAALQSRSKSKSKSKSKTKSRPKAKSKAKASPQTSSGELDRKRREQADNAAAISRASQQMEANERRAARSLDELQRVGLELTQTRQTLGHLNRGLDSLRSAIRVQQDSLVLLRDHYNRLKSNRIAALRRMQHTPDNNNTLGYIFGGSSLAEVYSRARYVKAYNAAWRRRTAELRTQAERVRATTEHLKSLRREQEATAADIERQRDVLAGREKSERELVQRLRGDNANLRRVLERRREQARQLEREIDRLIAEEIERQRREAEERQRREAEERRRREAAAAAAASGNDAAPAKPSGPAAPAKPAGPVSTPEADRALTGSFQSNKGKLLFPVKGAYRVVRPFGRSKHPDLPMVETDNSGVDLEVPAGSHARAVFGGTVTGVFKLPGYHTVVIVRHGDYLSLYANLESISVRKGQAVKAGQDLGVIVNDPESTGNPGKTLFHFELRRKRDKLNPMEWVR